MQTVTVDIINHKAIRILQDLELLELIKVRMHTSDHEAVTMIWPKYKGAMKKQAIEDIDKQIAELRGEWD